MSRDYTDTAFCQHCKKETMHDIHDDEHERDSSHDSQECLECHWYKYGYSREYMPPINQVVEALRDSELSE